MAEKNKFYKYNIKLRWPDICRNRSIQTLKELQDLVDKMNFIRTKVYKDCKLDQSFLQKGLSFFLVCYFSFKFN